MAKEPPFDVGDKVVIFADFSDAAGDPALPSAVALQIGRRDGTILETRTLPSMANPSAGRLEYAYTIPEPDLVFSWDAFGTVEIAAEGTIPTRHRTLAPGSP